jgi:hypothetical protein
MPELAVGSFSAWHNLVSSYLKIGNQLSDFSRHWPFIFTERCLIDKP